jgi:hypothetical protein
MQIARRLALALLGGLLAVSLLGTTGSHLANATIRDRETVKRWLSTSGLYDGLINTVLDESRGAISANVPLDDARVRSIANQAFDGSIVQENAEKLIDGTYAWLEGEAAQPSFRLDLGAAKQELASNLGNYATERAASLPRCSAAESKQLASGSVDVFSASCLPLGVTPEQIGEQLRGEVLRDDQFLSDGAVTNDGLKVTRDGRELSLAEIPELQRLQDLFRLGRLLPYVFGVLGIASFVGIVFLSSGKRAGLRRAGGITLVNGLLVGFSWLILDRSASWLGDMTAERVGQGSFDPTIARNLVGVIREDIGGILLTYALVYLGIGLAALLIATYFKRQPRITTKHEDPSGSEDDLASKAKEQDTKKEPVEAPSTHRDF